MISRFYFGNAYLAPIGTKLLVIICKQLWVSLFQLIIVPLFLSIVNILVTPVFGAGGGGGTKNETRHERTKFRLGWSQDVS
jgi:hypothetical protein